MEMLLIPKKTRKYSLQSPINFTWQETEVKLVLSCFRPVLANDEIVNGRF